MFSVAAIIEEQEIFSCNKLAQMLTNDSSFKTACGDTTVVCGFTLDDCYWKWSTRPYILQLHYYWL